MAERSDLDVSALKKALIDRKKELQKTSQISAESREAAELDQTRQGRLSRMDAIQQQAMAQETERRRQHEDRRIDLALERMEGEDYGYCLNCDEPIPEKRLTLDPSIMTCIECAS